MVQHVAGLNNPHSGRYESTGQMPQSFSSSSISFDTTLQNWEGDLKVNVWCLYLVPWGLTGYGFKELKKNTAVNLCNLLQLLLCHERLNLLLNRIRLDLLNLHMHVRPGFLTRSLMMLKTTSLISSLLMVCSSDESLYNGGNKSCNWSHREGII